MDKRYEITQALVTRLNSQQCADGCLHSINVTHGPVPGITDPTRTNADHIFNTEAPIGEEDWKRLKELWRVDHQNAVMGVDMTHDGSSGDWTVETVYYRGTPVYRRTL